MPCLSRNELNSFNFIRWKSATTLPLDDLGDATVCAGTVTEFPNRYNERDQRLYFPKMVMGKEISIYANLETPVTDADYANWICVFADRYGTVNSGHGTFAVSRDVVSGNTFRWYFSVTPDASDFSIGNIYRFVIYNTSSNNVLYVSNFLQAVAASDESSYAYLSYRNSTDNWSFRYQTLTSWRNKIFIDFNELETQPEIELTQYPEISTGDVRNEKSYAKEVITFEAEQFDKYANRAMLALSTHDDILINTNQMEVKEASKVSFNRRAKTNQGQIVFYNQSVSRYNLNG